VISTKSDIIILIIFQEAKMKQFIIVLMLSCIFLPAFISAKDFKPVTVTVDKLPGTVAEFTKMRDRLAVTPEGGAAVMITALMVFSKDKDLGLKLIVIALDRNNLSKGKVYQGFKPDSSITYHLDRIGTPERKHIPYGFVVGATPANGYKTDPPYKMEFTRNDYSVKDESTIKVFAACYGTDYPRPVTMAKNNRGLWKALELSSLFLDVEGPAEPTKTDDDL
jgi:hypothetical protein